MIGRSGKLGALAVIIAVAVCAQAALASSPPKTGTYVGTSTSNASGGRAQSFQMSIAQGKCAAAGAKARHKAYCVTVDALTGPQTTCSDGSIVEEFFPVSEPIALSAARQVSHTYILYSDASGQLHDTPRPGLSKVGSFEFSLTVSTSGTATGTMNYSVNGCDSGPVKITAKRKK